mgnify:CR=1 FL=1
MEGSHICRTVVWLEKPAQRDHCRAKKTGGGTQRPAALRGAPRRSMRLSWGMFGASGMRVEGIGLHLTALKVKQLQEEMDLFPIKLAYPVRGLMRPSAKHYLM